MTSSPPNPAAPPVSYDQPGAAEALGVSQRTLQRWTARGLVRPVKIGGKVLYSREELERFVKENAQGKDTP